MLWPIPDSYAYVVPKNGEPGSFWENRGDRFHCGVDIYAPFGSDVIAMQDGVVLWTEQFTSPEQIEYWNITRAITVQHDFGVVRYAEMNVVLYNVGERIQAGTVLGQTGQVLNPERISAQSPPYIRALKLRKNPTMLHLEIFKSFPFHIPNYLGGNIFAGTRPAELLDPAEFLG